MKIVIGLGNPGRDYQGTRHNVGFSVVDELGRRISAASSRSRFRSLLAEGVVGTEKVVLIKPQTYMNLSGLAVREAAHWYKAELSDLIVVVDDMDIPFGTLRLRPDGSAGGHNGLKSISAELGSTAFPRLRVGIGRGGGSATAHVLSRFRQEEASAASELVVQAADAVELWMQEGVVAAMNVINRKPERQPASQVGAEEAP